MVYKTFDKKFGGTLKANQKINAQQKEKWELSFETVSK